MTDLEKKHDLKMFAYNEDDENTPSEDELCQIKYQESNGTKELKKFREQNQVSKTAINILIGTAC